MATSKYQATCKLSRRVGTDLQLKSGVRDINSKCKLDRRPGAHWQSRVRSSDYSLQLKMKQTIRYFYRVLSEKQFKLAYEKAEKYKGPTDQNLMRLLESRLDNVVYRLGFASTRGEARQLISHRAILLNGRCVNIASIQVKPNDVIEVAEKSKGQARIQAALALFEQRTEECGWLSTDKKAMKGTFKHYPSSTDWPAILNPKLVVEFYSK